MKPDRSNNISARRLLVITGLAIAFAVATVTWWLLSAPRVDRERVYQIGYGNDAPLHFRDAEGQPAGLAVELVQEAARREGIRLNWVNLSRTNQNTIDLWVLKSAIPHRPSTLYLTAPYLQAESCFLVLDQSPVRDLPDLRNARVSHIDYLIHRETLPRLLDTFEPVLVANSREAVNALLTGRSDAAYIDQYTLFATLLSGEHRGLRVLPTYSPTRDLALAARPASAPAADAIRQGMQSMVTDGSLDRIMQRWIFFPNMTANIVGDLAEKQRSIRWLRTGMSALLVLLLISIGLMVVAQRRKNELRRSEKNHRELHESMTDAYARFDLQGRIKDTNPAFSELLGYTSTELLGMNERALTTPPWHEEACEIERQALPHGHSAVYERTYRRKDGTVFPVETRAFLLRDEDGHPAGWWEIVRDITERRQAEAEREKLQFQLVQSQKMEVVGRLAGGVAHDFNNMLQAILGNASLALSEVKPGSPVHESLEEIRISAERSAELTHQLLAFARRQTIEPKVLDLNATIEMTLKLIRRLIGEGVYLDWQPGPDVGLVRIDPSQLDQILTNLCVNARDAVRGTGQIRLETKTTNLDETFCAKHPGVSPGEFVQLSVRDDGCGMDAETLKHLFEPFFTTKAPGQGTGLGLATVYGVVSQNQGCVTATSAPGEGATFHVYLPRYIPSHCEAPAAVAAKPLPVKGNETVLLVEDEAPVLRVSKMLLDSLGYRVLVASSPREALAMARRHIGSIDLLLTDVIMPELNGRELAEGVRASQPTIKCVFMSGYDANVIAPHGVLQDGVHFLPKPFSTEALASKIRSALV